jgi:hypothetical protein
VTPSIPARLPRRASLTRGPRWRTAAVVLLGLAVSAAALRANSILPLALEAHLEAAVAVCRGTVVGSDSFQGADGHIHTRTVLQVDEVFKGAFGPTVAVVHPGGLLNGRGEWDGASPSFILNEESLLFLGQRADGTLFALQGPYSARPLRRATISGAARVTGPPPFLPPDEAVLQSLRSQTGGEPLAGADVTSQSAPLPRRTAARVAASHGLLQGHSLFGDGKGARFVQADRGEVIPYSVDMDQLPSGITTEQALQAVNDALAAWSAVSSLKFRFEGVQSFGVSANQVPDSTGRLWIQLHDAYNFITNPGTVGQGGMITSGAPLSADWGSGGNVAGHEFHRIVRGYAVIEHTNSAFSGSVPNLAEVVCHEVGHALGLAHSSMDSPESNPTLANAMMYFRSHGGGRGAVLGEYDPPIIRQAYPITNTPPYTFDRILDVTTHPAAPPNVPGINEVELRGYDLQNTALTVETTDASTPSSGSFSVESGKVKFTPNTNPLPVGPRVDPGSGSAYARIYYRLSDGTNASAFSEVRIISLNPDEFPPGASDGIPDDWQQLHFGNPDPGLVANAQAGDDADGDGFTNLQEYLAGTLPTVFTDKLRFTQVTPTTILWQASSYSVYEVQVSANLTSWTLLHPVVAPTTTTGGLTNFDNTLPHRFFRVIRVP